MKEHKRINRRKFISGSFLLVAAAVFPARDYLFRNDVQPAGKLANFWEESVSGKSHSHLDRPNSKIESIAH